MRKRTIRWLIIVAIGYGVLQIPYPDGLAGLWHVFVVLGIIVAIWATQGPLRVKIVQDE